MSDQVRPRCIVETSANLPPAGGGQAGQMLLNDVTSEDDLARSLGVSANASFGNGVFSADASVQYLSSTKLTSYSSYLLVTSSNQNARQLLTHYTLTNEAKSALRSGLPQFVKLCGDQYVSGLVTGGSISAVLSASSSTTAEQEDASATLHAAGFGGSLDASVKSKLQTYQDNGRLNIQIIRQGPAEAWPAGTVTDLISYAQAFPAKVAGNSKSAWTTFYLVSSYNEIFEKWNAPASQVAFYLREGPYLRQLYQARNDYTYISNNSSQFGATSSIKLNNEISVLGSEIGRVQGAANTCLSDPTECPQLAHLTLAAVSSRVEPWVPIDSTLNTYRQYFTVVAPDQKVLELQGDFWTQCGNHAAGRFGPTQWDVQFVSTKTGAVLFDSSYPGRPLKVPQDAVVNIHVIDFAPGDNCGVDNDGPTARLFTPVFPDDY